MRDALPDLWLRILDEPAITSTLMEDLALPIGQRIQGWGWGFVLPDTWVQQEQINAHPAAYVIRRIYAGILDGTFRLLSDAEIGAANAQGRFHFLNFYTQRRKDLDDPYVQSVFNIANEAFRVAASGYNTQAMYFETKLAESMLESLHSPLAEIERAWADEIEQRVAAFDRGEIPAYPAEDVFAEARRFSR